MFLSEICNVIGQNLQIRDKKIKNIKLDSRKLKKGDVFLCVNDGYKYVKEAIKRKVSLIILDRDIVIDSKIPIIRVDDTIRILGLLAKYLREQYHGKVIAVTGSNGKTTTKELLEHVLRTKYKVLKNVGSENNHIGVPKTLLNINSNYDFVVLELGTNHPGEIQYLTDIAKPDIALITNIGIAHIGNFGSKKKIRKEKLSIKGVNTTLFVNGEDKLLKKIDAIKVYTKDDLTKKQSINLAFVFKVCEYLGMKQSDIKKALSTFVALPSRMHYYKVKGITVIDDAYNASYESLKYGLREIKDYSRKIIVLGDILELGKYSSKIHKQVYREIKKLSNVLVITIGNETSCLKHTIHFNTLEDIIEFFKVFNFETDDVIYIKGSHNMRLFEIVEPLVRLVKK